MLLVLVWGLAGLPAGTAALRRLNYAYLQITRLICEKGRRPDEGWVAWQVRTLRNTRATIARYSLTLPSTAILARRFQLVNDLASSQEPRKAHATALLTYRADQWRERWPKSRWITRPRQRHPGHFASIMSTFEDEAHYVSSFDVQPRGVRTTEEIIQLGAAYRARLAFDEICE